MHACSTPAFITLVGRSTGHETGLVHAIKCWEGAQKERIFMGRLDMF
jgi:hypothetical protein